MTAAEALDMADRTRAYGAELYRLSEVSSGRTWTDAYEAYRRVNEAANALESLAASLALKDLKASQKAAA